MDAKVLRRVDGFKVSTSMDQASELILDIEDMSAPLGDGQDCYLQLSGVEEHVGVTVERAIVDGAYGSGKNGPPAQNARTNRLTCCPPCASY